MDEQMAQGPLYDDPFEWFGVWFAYASEHAAEHHACVFSTVSAEGQPSSRVVYLKEWDERGFVCYTNLESRKGREALGQGRAAMNLFWRELREQVRIEGVVEQVSDVQADAYFATRERGSQLGAWGSHQSEPVADREALLAQVSEVEQRFEGEEVPRPPFWSGLRIVPLRIEFWRAGAHRLHDRFCFTREQVEDTTWKIERLNP